MEERAYSKEEETIGAYYLKKKRTLPSGFGTMMMTATAQFFLLFFLSFFLMVTLSVMPEEGGWVMALWLSSAKCL
jgi:hypothetical protein